MKSDLTLLAVFIWLIPAMCCFAQTRASINTNAGASLLHVDQIFQEHNIPALSSREDTLRVMDSILIEIQMTGLLDVPDLVPGKSTSSDVLRTWGYPVKEYLFLYDTGKKKWVYPKAIVFFNSDVAEAIIRKD